MLGDMTWRKLPRDLLTNEQFSYIESKLPPQYAAAPYMFYLAALRQADDDGIFDLEDGVVFSRLMKMGTPELCFQIGNLMQLRHIITRVSPASNKCLINDWEYPKTKTSRTMAERRNIVLKKIDEEKKQQPKMDQFTAQDMQRASAAQQIIHFEPQPEVVDATGLFESNPAADFFCTENDKKQDFVVKKNDDDKIQKNVVIENQTEREIDRQSDRENLDRELKETHREDCLRGSIEDPLQQSGEKAAVAGEDKKETAENTEQSMTQCGNIAAPENESSYSDDTTTMVDEGLKGPVTEYMQNFFVKNCYGYKPNAGRKAVDEIASNVIVNLSDEMNPPEAVIAVICSEFKKLTETNGYYRGTPLLPAYLKKPGIWAHVVAAAGKILAQTAKQKKQFAEQESYFQSEFEKERQTVCDAMRQEYLKYNIDPDDPNRFEKLTLARKAATQK